MKTGKNGSLQTFDLRYCCVIGIHAAIAETPGQPLYPRVCQARYTVCFGYWSATPIFFVSMKSSNNAENRIRHLRPCR